MTRAEIATTLRRLIYENGRGAAGFAPDAITDEMSFVDDLSFDSLDDVEFTMDVECHFDIEISDDDAEDAKTVSDAINYLAKRLGVAEVVGA